MSPSRSMVSSRTKRTIIAVMIGINLALAVTAGLKIRREQKRKEFYAATATIKSHPDVRLEMRSYDTPKDCVVVAERFAACPDGVLGPSTPRFVAAHRVYMQCLGCWMDKDSKACLSCYWWDGSGDR